MITAQELLRIMPHVDANKWIGPLINTMFEFYINSPRRQAAFLAQFAHESGEFRFLKELSPGTQYEDRVDLGNISQGDGVKYKGRGIAQITGRKNYGNCGKALGLNLLEKPELLEEPENAMRSAGWFWTVGAGLNLGYRAKQAGVPVGVNLNDLADAEDFEKITLAINGGLNGQEDRLAYWNKAKAVLYVDQTTETA